MGKKSKKNGGGAKAKNAAAGSSTMIAAAAGGIGGSVQTSGGKKLKCVRCFGNIKDVAKAHQCPGCSDLFCWRCEKKAFKECPNGENCVYPIRRCADCAHALRYMSVANNCADKKEFFDSLEALIRSDERLSTESTPFRFCSGPDCHVSECHRCCIALRISTRLQCCVLCRKTQCRKCGHSPDADTIIALRRVLDRKQQCFGFDNDDKAEVLQVMRTSELFAKCQRCKQSFCLQCVDERFGRTIASDLLYRTAFGGEFLIREGICSFCYWSTKPCTNPNCPKEVGVPTKRCGGCHVDRYCSVECQVAMYPYHAVRCKKIQEKRLIAKDEHEERISIVSEETTCTDEDSSSGSMERERERERENDLRSEIRSSRMTTMTTIAYM